MAKCNCHLLDEDLQEGGFTCYACYELMKDNPNNWNQNTQIKEGK
jgi:hypothetical protein